MLNSSVKTVAVQPLLYNYADKSITIIMDNNQPLFLAKDVCEVLEYSDVSMTLQKLDDDEKMIQRIFVSSKNRDVWFVTQSGLYSLILRSNKPEARQFRKWITSEVIPALINHGTYTIPTAQVQIPTPHTVEAILAQGIPDNKAEIEQRFWSDFYRLPIGLQRLILNIVRDDCKSKQLVDAAEKMYSELARNYIFCWDRALIRQLMTPLFN